MRRFASFVNCFLQNLSIDTFKHKTDKYSVHFQEMSGFKGKRKWGLTLTLYKKPFRYRLPVSPVADLEGACGMCAPPPKIRKAYVIQR